MSSLRKIDYFGQLIIASLSIMSIVFIGGIGFLIGLFLIGGWQLLSAICNTYSFYHSGFQRRISCYWVFCISDIVLVAFTCSYLRITPDEFISEILIALALAGSVSIALYYWFIYYKLIAFLSLRNELDGLTKSKH